MHKSRSVWRPYRASRTGLRRAVILGVLSVGLTPMPVAAAHAEEVTFPDRVLELVVRTELGNARVDHG